MLQNQTIAGAGITSKVGNGLFLLYYGWYFLQGTGLFFQNIHLLPESFASGNITEILIISLMSLHSVGLYALFIVGFFMLIAGEQRANHIAVIYLIWKTIGLFVYTLPLVNLDDWLKSFLSIISKSIVVGVFIDCLFLFFYVRCIRSASQGRDEKNRRMMQYF